MPWCANTCRICGEISDNCHLIFDKVDIEEKIKKCLKLEDDFKPKQLCSPCLIKLDDFHGFLDLCHATDQKFESILMERQEQWPNNTILDYTQHKMSVIVSTKPTIDQLDCNDIDLYKETVLPLETCTINDHDMLEIVENASYTNLQDNLDYLAPAYTLKKFPTEYYPQESTVLRHSSTYQQEYQPTTFPDLNFDYTQYPIPPYPSNEPPPKNNKPTDKKFTCPHCDKKFKRRVTLNSHIAIHTKIRPYICEICQKTYAIKCDLTNHLKIHTDRHKCQYCPSSFAAPSKLERHLRTHTKDRPFKCDYKNCGKSFSDKRNLDGHKSIHSDIFNYDCKQCGKAFRTKNRLKQHGKAHLEATPYVCDVCSKAYKYKSTLIFHLKKHNGYFCPHCKKDCEKAVKLVKHKRICPNKPK